MLNIGSRGENDRKGKECQHTHSKEEVNTGLWNLTGGSSGIGRVLRLMVGGMIREKGLGRRPRL